MGFVQRTDFSQMNCSIARTASVVGESWSPLILRDVLIGIRRFDDLQAELEVSRKVLAARLSWLTEQGVLERVPYSDRPPRDEYVLTPKGRELCDLLLVMAAWGDKWMAGPAGPPTVYRHHACGEPSTAELRCSACGEPMSADTVDVLPAGDGGPDAGRG